MSLIVAHCSKRGIKAVSDTRLNDPTTGLPCPHFEGTLKILILSERLGFGFSGDPTCAWRAIETCQTKAPDQLDAPGLIEILLEIEVASSGATDFLVLSAEPTARLYKIAGGTVEESDQQLWIGDQAGFELYQKHFHDGLARFPIPYRTSPDYWRNEMDSAMTSVIESSDVPTVGDFLVPVSSDDGGLHYISYARLSFYPAGTRTSDGWCRTRPGTVGEGACSTSMLTPSNRATPAVGFHFLEPRFGVLFYPQKLRRPEIYRNVDVRSFVSEVSASRGVELQGYVLLN